MIDLPGRYDIVDFCFICQGDFYMYESVYIFDRLFWFFIRLLQDVRLKALTGSPVLTQIKCLHRISQNLTFYNSNERYSPQELKFQISANSAHYGQRNRPKTVFANFGHFKISFAISQQWLVLQRQFLHQKKALVRAFQKNY